MNVTAIATRSGNWWAIEVPEVPGVFTQAKRLDQVPDLVRDAVALMTDVPESTINVDLVPVVDEAVANALDSVSQKRARAETLSREASESMTELAKTLKNNEGMSIRDIGVILGVSYQRVGQLLNPTPPVKPASRRSERTAHNTVVRQVTRSGRSGELVQSRTTSAAVGQLAQST